MQSDGKVPVMPGLWEVQSTLHCHLSQINSGSESPRVVWSADMILSMGQIELNGELLLKWIAWSQIVLTFKLRTYTKLNCLKKNCF